MDLNQPLTDITFAAVDVETTGLSHKRDRIIEVSIITFRHTNILTRASWLINPETPVPKSASAVHHITDSMLKDKPDFKAVAEDISMALSNSVVVAHNARFDWKFLTAEFIRSGTVPPKLTVIDSIPLAKSAFPDQKSYSLSNLVDKLKIPASPNHRAESDTLALVYLVQICLKDIGPENTAKTIAPCIVFRPAK